MTFTSDLEALTALAGVKATQSDLLEFVRKLSVDIPRIPARIPGSGLKSKPLSARLAQRDLDLIFDRNRQF